MGEVMTLHGTDVLEAFGALEAADGASVDGRLHVAHQMLPTDEAVQAVDATPRTHVQVGHQVSCKHARKTLQVSLRLEEVKQVLKTIEQKQIKQTYLACCLL